MQDSDRQHSRLVRLCTIVVFLLALIIGNLAVWANAQTQSKPPVTAAAAGKIESFAPDTRVILLASDTGQWVLTTFAQAKPGNEFTTNNRLYRVVDSDKAQLIPNVDARGLVEADLPYDDTSHRPGVTDVVHVLGKDMRCLEHAVLSTVQPGATIRFQGKAYKVKANHSLADTKVVFSSETSPLRRIGITRSGLQHILDRHTVSGRMNAGKSTFNPGEDIQALITSTQLLPPVRQARGNSQRVFDAGHNIGTDRATNKPTSTYTVITTQSGKLVTAFPGLP